MRPDHRRTESLGAAVIVNWNGADDTLACLHSLLAEADGADEAGTPLAIVVDNGSGDGSLARITAGLAARGLRVEQAASAAPTVAPAPGTQVWLLPSLENLGFAAGCNAGLRAAALAGCATTGFLNNDTVVEPGAWLRLVQRLQADPACFATLPMLTVHGSDRIWNCGGTVWPGLGLRRYHLAGRPREEGARQGEIRCSFFTGCCFVVRTTEFLARGGFSERFFFGEEDFELGLWMREQGAHAVCVTSAVVQHKVSASFDAASGSRAGPRAFIYYLNRFIHMRLRFGPARWWLWSAAYLPYVALLLWRSGAVPAAELPRFGRRLLARAATMDGVARADFEAVMAGRW
jgi:GT2 family glycosyltransferase